MRRSVCMLEMNGGVHVFAAQFLLGPAENPRGCGVHECQAAFAIERVEPLHHGVHHGGAKVLGLLAVGDVDHDNTDPDHLLVDDDRVVAREPMTAITRVPPLAIDLEVDHGLTGVKHTAVDGLHLRPDIRDHLGDGAAELVLLRSAVHLGKGLVDANDPKRTIDEGKAHRSGRLERFDQGQ